MLSKLRSSIRHSIFKTIRKKHSTNSHYISSGKRQPYLLGYKGYLKTIIYCLLKAKHTMATSWKSIAGPQLKTWLCMLSRSLALEDLTFMIRGKYSVFKKIWEKFFLCLNNGIIFND
ncbi:hypothetical protein XENOCAPTIV_020988 [Xenoophorus captivus]|uniref:Maturase K n=1 Tax=Xenoophorus captivus TaxID=1517983 RepID=A0ABV0QSW7_9TELE